MLPVLGKTLGNFVITAPLGEGGMGEVFLATHRRMGRQVAIKLLRPQYSVDPAAVERLFNEARATSMVSHPGIVQIFDCDVFEGRAYLVMEFLEGQSLREHMLGWAAQPAGVPQVVSLSSQIASVLSAAHQKGIVHRDLKPDNVFMTQGHQPNMPVVVKVLDFGIAKLKASPAEASRLTGTGMLLGTPLYMSPEQCRGSGEIDERSDIYSLGCMMFEMLAGSPPFNFNGFGELIAAHLYEPAPSLSERAPVTPDWLSKLVANMLLKSPNERPQSMIEVEQTLKSGAVHMPQPQAPVGKTLILPSSQLPPAQTTPRVQTTPRAQTTTLRAAATEQVSTPISPNRGVRLAGGLLLLGILAGGAWALLGAPDPTSKQSPSATQLTDDPGLEGVRAQAASPTRDPELSATTPDAGQASIKEWDVAMPNRAEQPNQPQLAPKPRNNSRPKRNPSKPFRGFDEL